VQWSKEVAKKMVKNGKRKVEEEIKREERGTSIVALLHDPTHSMRRWRWEEAWMDICLMISL
jgi:hypothetical protein